MQGDFFAILRLRPGQYDTGIIDRQYRSVRQEILRAGGPDRQNRLDDALIARCVLANPARQAALRRRHTAAVRRRPPRRPIPVPARALPPAVPESAPAAPPAGEAQARFTRMVLQHMESGLLRFTARQRLVQLAAGLGIDAFKANLLIAEALHDVRAGRLRPPLGPAAPPPAPHRYGLRLAAALLLSAAASLTLAAWLIF